MWLVYGKLHLSTLFSRISNCVNFALLLCSVPRVFLQVYCRAVIALVAHRQKFWVPTSMVAEKQWFLLVLSARNWNNKSFILKKLVPAQSKECSPSPRVSSKECNKRRKEGTINSFYYFPNIVCLAYSLVDQYQSFYRDCVLILRFLSDVNCGSFVGFSRAELFYTEA